MNLKFPNNKDVWAGIMLIAIGAAAMVIARNYSFGTALRIGPGYFPVILGALLTFFGLFILARGLRRGEAIAGSSSLRALTILPLSLVLFGVLMEHGGFVPAMIVLIFGSATASTEIQIAGGFVVFRRANRAVGRGLRLGARPALPVDHGLKLTSWTSSTT
jgi:hypothetical protein